MCRACVRLGRPAAVRLSRQLLQVEQQRVTATQSSEVCGRFVTPAADRQFVGAEDNELLQPTAFEAHAALAVHGILECLARKHQLHRRQAATAASAAFNAGHH